MIQTRTILTVADNSGAVSVRVIHVFGGSKRRFGRIGDIINSVVLDAEAQGNVKDGEMVKAVIARTKKEHRRSDGSYIRFSDNAAILIDNAKDKNPRGTRIFGPVAREIKELGFTKIASMAKEVI